MPAGGTVLGKHCLEPAMPFAVLTPDIACAALAAAGLAVDPAEVRVEEREERWLARLPGQKLAWFAASAAGRAQLATERRVLRLLEARCAFCVPRIVFEPPSGEFDVRSIVAGDGDPWSVYAVVQRSPEAAVRIGAAVGAILAEQHSCIAARDVAGWLPVRPSWPESRVWIRERLPGVIGDAELQARADDLLCAYEELSIRDDDRVLAHTDVGLHNLAIDADSYDVRGVFDYDGAAWADRHHDFRYLVLDADRYELLDAASAVYERATSRSIDRKRVLLYNAACALSFLAFRSGHRPDERWCGRTLDEDLAWSTLAIGRVHVG
jgi:Phosphotransferase enzyme family